MTNKSVKVIFDTNVWISFLIGKRLSSIKNHIVNGSIVIIISDQLLEEIKLVTSRKKLKKYFDEQDVKELIELLEIIAVKIKIRQKFILSRDPKDNFLFDLIYASKADFLVTGDKDVLVHHPFKSAQILTPADFEKQLSFI